jgi:hypothetical protein
MAERWSSQVGGLNQVGDYIENFYHRLRLHSTPGYRSAVVFELAHQVRQLQLSSFSSVTKLGQVHGP